MAIITFQCYACNQLLKVDSDKGGKKTKCIKCGTVLTIPVAQPQEEAVSPVVIEDEPPRGRGRDDDRPRRGRDDDDDGRRRGRDDDDRGRGERRDDEDYDRPRKSRRDEEDDYDRPRKSRRDEEDDYDRPRRGRRDEEDDYDRRSGAAWGSWPKVGIGMTLVTVSGGVLAGAAGIGFIATLLSMIAALAGSGGLADAGRIIGAIGALIFFAVAIPSVVGYVFCLFSPNKRGAMAWAIVVLSAGAMSLVFRIIWMLIPAINSFSRDPFGRMVGGGVEEQIPFVPVGSVAGVIIVSILILLLMYAEYVLLPFYITRAGNALGARDVARGNTLQLIVASIGVGLKFVIIILVMSVLASFFRGGGSPGAMKAWTIIIGILGLLSHAAFVLYGILVLGAGLRARRAIARAD